MTDRHTVDTINSDQLDALYDRLNHAEAEARRHTEADSADAAAGSYAGRAEGAESTVTRVTSLYEQWVKTGPPPLGTPIARWWDRRLAELHAALDRPGPTNPPGSTREQLPAETLTLLNGYLSPYLSTACATAGSCERACRKEHPHMVGLLQHAEQLHARCRLSHKFTGQPCTCGCHPPGPADTHTTQEATP